MPEESQISAEIERNERIAAEFERLSCLFQKLPENKKSIVLPLIQNAAFMFVTLDDLQKIIAEQGPVEAYQNGENQYGMKQSAALQSYNSMIKNYAAVVKTLYGLLPETKKQSNPFAFTPREKTAEEREEERRQDEEKRARINAEIEAAAERQRREREKEKRS